MEVLKFIISEYGTTILYAIGTAIFGALGVMARNIYNKYATTKTKKDVVEISIKAVEQIYTDIHGKEKLQKAMQGASEMLAEKGITISELELTMLIEATLAEFNGKFKNSKGIEQPLTITSDDVKAVTTEHQDNEASERADE